MPIYNSDINIYQITDDAMYAAASLATTTLLGTMQPSILALIDKLGVLSIAVSS